MDINDKLRILTGQNLYFNGLVIKQPTVGEIIDYGWKKFFEIITSPYIVSWDYVNIDESVASENKYKIFDLFWYEGFMVENYKGIDVLVQSLKFIFKTDNIELDYKNKVIFINYILLHRDNFDDLCGIINSIFRMNKFKKPSDDNSEEEKLKNMDRNSRAIYERYLINQKKSKQKNGSDDDILKIINYIVHSQSVLDYKTVLNLTLFQLFNTQTTYAQIDNYRNNWEVALAGGGEGKLDLSHWLEKFKMDK